METRNGIGIAIVVLLAALLVVSVVWVAKGSGSSGSKVTGAATADYQGYSSYEEMMAAHHGSSASQGVGGCGNEQVASHDSAPQGSGEMAVYGVTYDSAGYTKLLGYANSINLDAAQTKLIVGLDIQIPCCGVTTLQASDNCECGHHVALYGLAKLLASKGYDKADIQTELDKWKEVFYPGGGSGNTGGC